jgi:predicted RNA-binding Zn ribbon-like protein
MPVPTDPNSSQSIVPFRFGGHDALDFVNTVDSWVRPITRDYIDNFAKLVGWTRQVGLIDDESAERLVRRSSSKRATVAHCEAIEVRRVLLRAFGAIIDGTSPHNSDIATLNALLKEVRGKQDFVALSGKFDWVWTSPLDARTPILRVALAAGDLLELADLTRLKQCPGPDGCGWLFLDESRNRSRKWCSMEYCGSFAKARRFAESHR